MYRTLSRIIGIAAIGALSASTASAAGDRQGDPESGRTVYNEACVACHGENGKGAIPGAPDFTKKDGALNTESDTVLLNHILNGFRSPNSTMSMPPKGGDGELTVQDIRNVLAYLHKAFHYRKR